MKIKIEFSSFKLFPLIHILFKLSLFTCLHVYEAKTNVQSKIEKVPKDIQGEKSEKETTCSGELVSTIGAYASPKGTEPGVRKNKHSLLECHTRCIWPIKSSRNSVKVKLGFKVIKLV